MFKHLKLNWKDRDCITISSDSEPGDDDDDASSYCSSYSSFSSIKNENVIDEIVDNYTKKFKKRENLRSSFSSLKKKRLKQDEILTHSVNKDELRLNIKKLSPKEERCGLSFPIDKGINNILNDLLKSPMERKQVQNKRVKEKADTDQANLCSEFPFDRELKVNNFKKVFKGEMKLKDICLSCGCVGEIACPHPLFEGGLCKSHMEMFQEWFFKYDHDGCSSYCSICCMGENVVICDRSDCGRCYCSSCLDLLVGPREFDYLSTSSSWLCYFCEDKKQNRPFIIKRQDWRSTLQLLFTNSNQPNSYPLFPVPVPIDPENRRPIRVLSLFDGIATGLIALKQLGIKVEKFVASEIDESAIRLVQNRHPDVIHIGDITQVLSEDIEKHGPFDLVIGGSPCNDLSGANPRRKGLVDLEGTGCLFFDFYRIWTATRPPARCRCEYSRPFFWLFENVLSMKHIERDRISRFFECDPIVADARVVSAAARPRLFWGNLPHMKQLNLAASPGDKLSVQSCLEKDRVAMVEKLNTITTKTGCLYQGGQRIAPVKHRGKDDVLWTTEIERIFGVPEHYTDVNNLGPKERLALLGRSWSVPVMRQLLAPLKEYFASTKLT